MKYILILLFVALVWISLDFLLEREIQKYTINALIGCSFITIMYKLFGWLK